MEWNFTFDNQEAGSFLVYRLDPSDQLDTIAMGMLNNNRIPHLLPMLYSRMDEERFLRYTVASGLSLQNFLEGTVTRERFLNVLEGICDASEEAQAYMLDSRMLVLDKRYIFANVATGEVSLAYLPLEGETSGSELGSFLREILFSARFDPAEDCSYVAAIMNAMNGGAPFQPAEFRRLLQELKNREDTAPVPETAKPEPEPKPLVKPAAKPAPKPVPRPVPRPRQAQPAPGSRRQEQPVQNGRKPGGIKMPFPGKKPEGIKMPFPGEKPEGIKMPFPGNKPEGIKMPFPGRKPEGFGETSVLSQERGVTTVLGSNSSPAACTEAFLVRKKNGQAMKIQKPLFRIGTEKTFVDFWIPDNTAVSHSHADILEENGSYYLRDNHSTNHTYVNGTMLPADQKKLLQDQDQIVLGNEAFVFEYRQEVV